MKISFTNLTLVAAAFAFSANTATAQLNCDAISFGAEIKDSEQGTRKNGFPVLPLRSNENNVLGIPEGFIANGDINQEGANIYNYFSLGFDKPETAELEGWIEIKMTAPFGNREGADFKIFETSYGTPSCNSWKERARAFVSQDGCHWVQVFALEGAETICQDGEFDLGDLDWAQYVRIEDASNPNDFGNGATVDAYDVDGVVGYCVANVDVNMGLNPLTPVAVHNAMQGKTKSGGNIATNRSFQNRALFDAPASDANGTLNFFAIGFDRINTAELEGWIELRFNYTVFDGPGADINVFETTWGDNTTRPCNNYPERALFYGSMDGSNWTALSSANEGYPGNGFAENELCRDGQLDISAMPNGRLRFVRIVDNSERNSTRFPNSADAYDIDYIVATTACVADDGKIANFDVNNVPDEEFYVGIFPNPVVDVLSINIETSSIADNYMIRVVDLMGRTVLVKNINVAAESSLVQDIDVKSLTSGIYLLSVESTNSKQTVKLLKQ